MRPADVALAILITVLWGGNFVALKYGLSHFPPFFLTALRFALVSLMLLPFFSNPPHAHGRLLVQISMLNTLHFSLPYVGMSAGLSIASTALTGQIGVPFACLLSALFFGDRLGPWRSLGMAIAFIGIFIVFGSPNVTEHRAGFLLALTGAFFWACATVLMKQAQGVRMLPMIAWTSMLSVPQLFLISWFVEPGAWRALLDVPIEVVLSLLYTSAISTIVAHGLWYHLLRHHPVSHVTPFSLLTPVIGTLFGFLFFGEVVGKYILGGGLVTLLGVAIIVIRRPKLAALGKPL